MDVSAGLRWRDDLSIGFALIVTKQEGWNVFGVKMSWLETFLLKCHHWWYFSCGWMNSMLKGMNVCANGFVSWIEMEGWSEYRFRIDCCKAEQAELPSMWKCHDWWHFLWKCHDWWHFYWNVTTCDISIVVEWIACWSEWMFVWMDVSAGLRWRDDLSIGFALIIAKQEKLKCRLCENVTTGDIFTEISQLLIFLMSDWMNSLLKMNGFMCGDVCVSWIEM